MWVAIAAYAVVSRPVDIDELIEDLIRPMLRLHRDIDLDLVLQMQRFHGENNRG